jgi:beta-phosphoglucomutase-like phosphatase (HAD superfamily)
VIFDCDGVLVDSGRLAVRTVAEVVRQLDVPMCVASGGRHKKMRFTLGKPAPDVFLHAAAVMGASPARCAVVEDSVSGVTAGLASGMTVFAFAGGVTNAARLSIGTAIVFDDMHMLPEMLSSD